MLNVHVLIIVFKCIYKSVVLVLVLIINS